MSLYHILTRRFWGLAFIGFCPLLSPTSIVSAAAAPTPLPAVEFDHVEGSIIHFKPAGSTTAAAAPGTAGISGPTGPAAPKPSVTRERPKPLQTKLFDLNFIGALDNDDGEPFFLFSGRPCKDCMQDPAIYAVKPSGGKVESFIYPGKIVDSKTGQVVNESRAFFGKCIKRMPKDIYVVFQWEKVDRRRGRQSSVYIAEPGQGYLEGRLVERGLPRLNDTLRYVRHKSCHEIEGRDRRISPKSFILTPGKPPPSSD